MLWTRGMPRSAAIEDLMTKSGRRIITILLLDGSQAFLDSVQADRGFNLPGWEIRAEKTVESALEYARDCRVDVFVVGEGVPADEAIDFLERSKQLASNSLRIVIENDESSRKFGAVTGLAHRRIMGPAAPAALNLAIRQVLVTHLRIRRPEVSGIVRGTKELHINTKPMRELIGTANDPGCEIEDLAAIVSKHPTAVATILQVANTPFFGAAGGVESVEEALHRMGVDFVRNLAITELAKKQLRLSPGLHELANAILAHSVEVSQYGLRMRQHVSSLKLVQQLSSIALLHDLGKLVLLAAKGNDYADLMGQSVDSETPSWRLERAVYGCDHAAVGGFLFAMWGLPEVIVRATTWHHQPDKVAEEGFCPVSLLHFANSAAHANQSAHCYCGDRLNEELAVKKGLAPEFVYEFA